MAACRRMAHWPSVRVNVVTVDLFVALTASAFANGTDECVLCLISTSEATVIVVVHAFASEPIGWRGIPIIQPPVYSAAGQFGEELLSILDCGSIESIARRYVGPTPGLYLCGGK